MPKLSDLHSYQQYCVSYIETHETAAIFLDCGLGKTIITLTATVDLLFDSFETHRILVIAPLRVARRNQEVGAPLRPHLCRGGRNRTGA